MTTTSEHFAITCGIKPIEVKGHTIYPDFRKPENFVKLYEMTIPKSYYTSHTIAELLIAYDYDCSTVTNFLRSLESFLIEEDTKLTYKIRTKIRRSKWE